MKKVAAVVNYSVWDTTLVLEARKWIRAQLQKKRRVFQNVDDTLDFALFATDVNSIPKLERMIAVKFPSFKENLTLKEITSADAFENDDVDLDVDDGDGDESVDLNLDSEDAGIDVNASHEEELEEAVSNYTTRRRL